MSTLRATNIQHADAAAVGILLAADGTVGGLRPTQNTQTGTAVSLALTDSGRTVTLSNAAAVTVTVPAQATVAWNAGETISLLNLGVGTVTVVAAAGVTINGTPLTLATSKGGSLVRTAINTWTFIPTGAGGKVLQVESIVATRVSTTGVATFATLSITPTFTTSKILVMVNAFVRSAAPSINNFSRIEVNRSGLGFFNQLVGNYVGSQDIRDSFAGIKLDSPNTTSSLTYTATISALGGTSSVDSGYGNDSSLTLMEVAA
jgi:hypothetical protein